MPKIPIDKYKTWVFDCDGVILNSNHVKTEAFHSATITCGRQAADAMVQYHVRNGGISRYHKFEYFLRHILGKEPGQDELESLLASYARLVRAGLMHCEVADGLKELRRAISQSRWLVVSGGDQAELRDIFSKRGLDVLFDGGIFGSPDNKCKILERELSIGNIKKPAVFIGDSRYDYEAASGTGLDFIFMSEWSEFHGWEDYLKDEECRIVSNIDQLSKILE